MRPPQNPDSRTVECILDARARLGEGPCWDPDAAVLWWVDIMGGQLHRFDPATRSDTVFDLGEMVGAAVRRARGGMALALHHGFALFDPDSGRTERLGDPEAGCNTRFNDGKCDPAGRFWAGTMALDGRPGQGALYMLTADGVIEHRRENVSISNGLAWSADGTTMYYIDTPTQRVLAFDFDLDSGAIANERPVIEIPETTGAPDGMTIDDAGMLWIALWDGWAVTRWDPASGRQLDRIDVPARRVTSCCFGGPGRTALYITTARTGLDEAALAGQPLAGGLFVCEPGVTGPPPHAYAG